ncbi:MAG: FHA domain-containing protein [Chloroflexota bacterium]
MLRVYLWVPTMPFQWFKPKKKVGSVPHGPRLKALTGPDRDKLLDIALKRKVIGRQESADFVLRDPDGALKISRAHAFVWLEKEGAMIADHESTHGVMVNGARIPGATPLADGDRIGLGKVELVYEAPTPDWHPPEAEPERKTRLKPRAATPPADARHTKLKPKRGE